MKRYLVVMTLVLVMVGGLGGSLLASDVAAPMEKVIADDSRNSGIRIDAYYHTFFDRSVLVLDVISIEGSKTPMDIFRIVLQYAQAMKDVPFRKVELASKGNVKFYITGEFFKKLGDEYGSQNPMYTIRMFPENVYNPDGSRAFSTWTGGVLGVASKQMEDFSNFHKQWYIGDL